MHTFYVNFDLGGMIPHTVTRILLAGFMYYPAMTVISIQETETEHENQSSNRGSILLKTRQRARPLRPRSYASRAVLRRELYKEEAQVRAEDPLVRLEHLQQEDQRLRSRLASEELIEERA